MKFLNKNIGRKRLVEKNTKFFVVVPLFDKEIYGQIETAVKAAIDLGYRYFDTSNLYGNEIEIGLAIAQKIEENVIKRSDIIVANKFCCTYDDSNIIEKSCRKSLEKFKLNSFDIYLLHIPTRCVFQGDEALFPIYSEPKHSMK